MKVHAIIILLVLLVLSCGCREDKAITEIQKADQELTAENQNRLIKSVPAPKMTTSLEREQLVKRLKRFNVSDKISYIYLISHGKVMAFYPIKGKVSSVNSKLTCTQQIYTPREKSGVAVVESPALDGSYGSNGNAIFFFTTEDVYVEWPGEYMLVDQPMKLSTPPELVYIKQVNKK